MLLVGEQCLEMKSLPSSSLPLLSLLLHISYCLYYFIITEIRICIIVPLVVTVIVNIVIIIFTFARMER